VGKRVVAIDIDGAKVERVNAGEMPFRDRGADIALRQAIAAGLLRATSDADAVTAADAVVTVIATPVDDHLSPRFDIIRDFIGQYRGFFRPGQLLILRSTLFPGTTQRVQRLLEEEGLTLDLAFCPERVAEGVALEEIRNLPQIVAGCTPRSQERAEALFRQLTPEVVVVEPLAAELAKLFNNSWRYIQFAVANQFFMIANDCGVDFYDVHRAMTENYPRGKGFPRAGFAAGPCLFKDTMQLSAFHNNNFFLGHAAMLVNEGLPGYLVKMAARRFDLRSMTVGILGMTFKGDSDDTRDSLAIKLKNILDAEAHRVLCSDPNLHEPWLTPQEKTIEESDLLFIGAPHTGYRELDFRDTPVFDPWNIVPERVQVL